jgi:hypothetical protein
MSRHTRRRSRLRVRLLTAGAGIVAAAAAVATVTVASADEPGGHAAQSAEAGADHAVFVQGSALDGNTIHVLRRGKDGALSAAGRYATGGKGGDQVDAPTDSLSTARS